MRLMLCSAPLFASLCFLLAPVAGAQGTGAVPVPLLEIRGQVLDGTRPVSGAEVFVVRAELPLPGAKSFAAQRSETETLRSDAEGRFLLQIAPWRRVSVWAREGERVSPVIEDLDTQPPGAAGIQLTLAPGERIRGQLDYRRRAPGIEIPYRLIRLPTAEEAISLHFEGDARPDGTFSTELLPPGSYQLKLGATAFRLQRPVVLESGAEQRIPLVKAISLRGRLVGGDGMMARPLAGVTVELLDAMSFGTAMSAADGTFTIGGIEEGPGPTLLLMPDPELGLWQRDIQALLPGLSPRDEAPQFELALQPARLAKGKVLRADGKPAQGIRVLARCFLHVRGISTADISVSTRTSEDGGFELRGLQNEAAYDVIALSERGDPQLIGRIEPSQQTSPVAFEDFVLGSHRILGALSLAEGIPPGEVELRLYGPKSYGQFDDFYRMVRLEDGSYLSPSMPIGEYAVFAVSKRFGFARGVATIRANEVARPIACRIALAKPRELQGVVLDANEQPVANAAVQLLPAGSTPDGGFPHWHDFVGSQLFPGMYPGREYMPSVKTDANGRWRLTCLEGSGDYDLYVTPPSGAGAAEQDRGVRHTGALARQNPIVLEVR